MNQLIRLAGECPDGKSCPSAWTDGDGGEVYVVGTPVTDPDILAKAGEGETVIAIPRDVWEAKN